ncbi:MAG: type II secretion system F family protein [Candidatus Aenigmarchaeota archaeon]|nr:type II secretion system F family protein [Candidatus Aenigmarchaeota archaeon]
MSEPETKKPRVDTREPEPVKPPSVNAAVPQYADLEIRDADELVIDLRVAKFTLKKKVLLMIALNTALVASILTINFLMLSDVPELFSTINIIAVVIFALPIVLLRYTEYNEVKEIEEMFPVFLRDFVETIRGGMTLPAAIKAVAKNDYKALNSYVKRMAAQLDWGIAVERVMISFGKRSKSKLIMRIISSVVESQRFGGNISDTFEALSNTAVQIDRLRQERSLSMNSQMITGYVVFFVFLGVMLGLQNFLVPSLGNINSAGVAGSLGSLTGSASGPQSLDIAGEYKVIFRNLIIIQGLFAGLSVGKMAEGEILGGVKHSALMMLVGFVVFAVAG